MTDNTLDFFMTFDDDSDSESSVLFEFDHDYSPQTPEEWYMHNVGHAKNLNDYQLNKEKYSKQICDCRW